MLINKCRPLHLRGVVATGFAMAMAMVQAETIAPQSAVLSPAQREVLATEGMQAAHPDFRWRMAGLRELDRRAFELAHTYLTRAARYADKPAQAMVAELLWTGVGIEKNRPLAYAWMDLAAERGYVVFVAHREKYWQALTTKERAAALALGAAVYAEYGDDVAKPRLEKKLARAHRRATGSYARVATSVRVYRAPTLNPSGGGGVGSVHGNKLFLGTELVGYYDDRLWKPRVYWQWQDQLYGHLPEAWRHGEVDVGELQPESERDSQPDSDKEWPRGQSS